MEDKAYHDHNNFINCYCDASYSKQAQGSVIGYKIGDHEIETQFLAEIKNTEAEIVAAKICIEKANAMYPNKIVCIYTDCQKVMKLYANCDGIIMHKMIGHMKTALKDKNQKIFTTVDRATRKELRRIMKEKNDVLKQVQ